jgi:light-regulated signal transduction histidine kinase (bacteriophytochrome)
MIALDRGEVQPYRADEIELAVAFASHAAITIENARLYEQIQRQAVELEDRVAERTAELAVVNRELEAFVYSVSHDLRAPLRGINGYAVALMEDCGPQLGPDGQHYLGRIREAGQWMGQLIDDLLGLSRISRSELVVHQVHLDDLAREIALELAGIEPARQVEFAIADGLVVQGDPRLLRVALQNLLGNAHKFTSKQPRARIELGAVDREDGTRAFYVRDDGIGFDMDDVGRLFVPFQRLHSAAGFEGDGIGLATVKRILERHGGSIWAEGVTGQGATFYFTVGTRDPR